MLDRIALILATIGAINWGLVGIFRFNLVGWIFNGSDSAVSRIIFALVGIAGLWCISLLFRERGTASDNSMT